MTMLVDKTNPDQINELPPKGKRERKKIYHNEGFFFSFVYNQNNEGEFSLLLIVIPSEGKNVHVQRRDRQRERRKKQGRSNLFFFIFTIPPSSQLAFCSFSSFLLPID